MTRDAYNAPRAVVLPSRGTWVRTAQLGFNF